MLRIVPLNCALLDVGKGASRAFGIALGKSGGILTWPLSPYYHLFSKLHKTSMNTGDFYDLACCNYFHPFA